MKTLSNSFSATGQTFGQRIESARQSVALLLAELQRMSADLRATQKGIQAEQQRRRNADNAMMFGSYNGLN
jgi:hypothetical protein